MVLIPPDAGIRMRLQTETHLQPVTPSQAIPSDLPDLQPGQVFNARIQEVLPENLYRALVAGRTLTLALPEGAKAGDALELVVIDRTPKLITARVVQTESQELAGEPYPHATLSPAARLIASLLPASDQPARPVLLNRGEPLLPAPPAPSPGPATPLAARLSEAVSESGLFYEAHQAQWLSGEVATDSLLREPQGKHLPFRRDFQVPSAGNETISADQTGSRRSDALQTSSPNATSTPMPEDLKTLVQQQLEAAGTQRLAWHGEVWPGQAMDWTIEPDLPERREDTAPPEQWATTLALTMPALGRVEAMLKLTSAGVSIDLTAPTDATADQLRNGTELLSSALEAAGVPLRNFMVRRAEET